MWSSSGSRRIHSPGDNTFSNYQEANRNFWRNTVVPLLTRGLASLSDWLGDAYPGGPVILVPDLDQVEALSPERDAFWARLEKTSFLTDVAAEQRQQLSEARAHRLRS